jgi:molybdenum cofactor cytidylyltransferase
MMAGASIAALILAAGQSSRMGALKPLLPLARSTVLGEAVMRFREAGLDDVRVVTGHKAEELAPTLKNLAVTEVFNPDYEKGMLSSVLAGLRSLEPDIEAFFLLPVDLPLVKPRTIEALLRAYRRGRPGIIYPCFQGRRGHPPLIPVTCVVDLPQDYEGGLRAFLSRYDAQALDLEVVDEAVLLDCNTPADYRRLQAYGMREDIPTENECRAIWAAHGVSEQVIAHCRLVAEVARTFAIHLKCAGFNVNLELVVAAANLHDLARGQPDHARAGARMLAALGYPQVARVVGAHMDLQLKRRSFDEADLVYLADKCVEDDRLVTLEERFHSSLERFAANPEALKAVAKRFQDARVIQERVEEILGTTLEEILRRYERSMRLAATDGSRAIYLIRHGAVRPQGSEKRYVGQLDLPLIPEGRRQAEALRERLRHTPLTAIYCSDLQRSLETAAIIAEPHGLDPCAVKDFREIGLGEWEGLPFAEVRRRSPAEYEERGRDFIHFRPPGGENFLDCACRVLPAFYEVLRATRGDILIVGHAGVNRTLLCQALGQSMNTLFDIEQDYGCLNLVRYQDLTFELEILNDIM